MGFIQNIVERYRQQTVEKNTACEQYIMRIDRAMQEMNGLFTNSLAPVTPQKERLSGRLVIMTCL